MKNKQPYKKFSEVYNKIMRDGFYLEYYKFINKIFKKLKFKPRNILELACGTGKLAHIFLKNGHKIEGADISNEMLKFARKKGIKCFQKNIAKFNLGKKFDLILCTYDSLNYLKKNKDLEDCFRCVKKHLYPGGLFIFDLNSEYKINKIIASKFKEIGLSRYYKIKKMEIFWLNLWRKNKWIAKIIIFEKIKSGFYRRFIEEHIEAAYGFSKVKKILKKTGFKIIGVYSDFRFNPVTKNSLRWFFVCRV
jgi:SAM-dependent methyltransferase